MNYLYISKKDVNSRVFVFDLDDTLYSELTFKFSGIRHVYSCLKYFSVSIDFIIDDHHNWLENIFKYYTGSEIILKESILKEYRSHRPLISMYNDSIYFLNLLLPFNPSLALITDGRSITQRNKILSLGLSELLNYTLISEEFGSEKPAIENFKEIEKRFPEKKYFYFADNTIKDFISPNKLGWETVCVLDRGDNIHYQDFSLATEYLPKYILTSFFDVKIL